MYYFLGLRALLPLEANHVVVDIGTTLDRKIAAVACYESQFAHRQESLDRIRAFSQQQGLAAGFEAGEVLASPIPLATRDLMGLVFCRDRQAPPDIWPPVAELPPEASSESPPPSPEIGEEAGE